MKEWAHILETEFPHLKDNRDLFLGHLWQECPVLSEDCGWKPGSARSDYGMAIGIAQWHLCYRYTAWLKENKLAVVTKDGCRYLKSTVDIRAKFFEDHPDMRNHFGQVRKYFGDITTAIKTCEAAGSKNPVYCSILSWNSRAGHPYFLSVESNAKYVVPKYL